MASIREKYVVIGLGDFGSAIARKLSARGAEVLAIDNNEHHIETIKDQVAYAVMMDSTDKKALLSQNVQDADAVVIAIGKNFEALLLTTVHLMELRVKRLIARASGEHQRKILEKMGVEEILSPENEVGNAVAEKLINPNILSFLQMPDGYEVVEIKTPIQVANRTLKDIDLRNKYNINLITVKRCFQVKDEDGENKTEQHILGVPVSSTTLYDTDTIVVFGKAAHIEKFIEINQ
jgi:trk system potassium uptake protein TrkA